MAKLLEKVILTRLQDEVDTLNLIPNEQHGFRAHHSTTHQLLRVVEQITEGFNINHSTGAVFLDVSKAFDKVWHNGLVYKLLRSGMSLSLVKIIKSFLKNRTFQVKHLGSLSTIKPIVSGVPQGSILSPLLYNIFMHDIPLNTAGTTLAQYADDTAILYRSRSPRVIFIRLQAALENLDNYFNKWRISINPAKTVAILFSRRRNAAPPTLLNLLDHDIPWSDTCKYLGVILDKKLTWSAHIHSARNKATACASKLFPLLHPNSTLSLDNKLLIYKSIIRPALTYAIPVWGHSAVTHIRHLQAFQNKILRQITASPWFVRNTQIHDDLYMPTIPVFAAIQADNLRLQMTQITNPTINQLWSYDQNEPTRHRRPKRVLT